jgi:predicted RNA polymerase sigma factor
MTLRIRGDLARTEGRLEAAETDYETAVALARSMGASTLMQRAQSSLAGLRRTIEDSGVEILLGGGSR